MGAKRHVYLDESHLSMLRSNLESAPLRSQRNLCTPRHSRPDCMSLTAGTDGGDLGQDAFDQKVGVAEVLLGRG
jgi:hypothetical protein